MTHHSHFSPISVRFEDQRPHKFDRNRSKFTCIIITFDRFWPYFCNWFRQIWPKSVKNLHCNLAFQWFFLVFLILTDFGQISGFTNNEKGTPLPNFYAFLLIFFWKNLQKPAEIAIFSLNFHTFFTFKFTFWHIRHQVGNFVTPFFQVVRD